MPRKTSATLTEAELRLMNVLWERGEASVADVVATLGDPPLAYTSVLTTLRILERKGFVRHRTIGRAFVYKPKIERGQARTTAVDQLVRRFFDGSKAALMLQLVDTKTLDPAELRRLRALLDEDFEKGES